MENLFTELSLEACRKEKVDTGCKSLDTTSISLTGNYNQELMEGEVKVTHGYSKDNRPDLKQVVQELLVS